MVPLSSGLQKWLPMFLLISPVNCEKKSPYFIAISFPWDFCFTQQGISNSEILSLQRKKFHIGFMVRRSHLLRYFCKEIFIFQSHAILKWFEMFIIFYCLLYCHGKSWKHDAPVAVSLKSPNAGAHGLLLKERTEMCTGWECRTNKIPPSLPPKKKQKKKKKHRKILGQIWVKIGILLLLIITHSLTHRESFP